jgi:hypothetical protein
VHSSDAGCARANDHKIKEEKRIQAHQKIKIPLKI